MIPWWVLAPFGFVCALGGAVAMALAAASGQRSRCEDCLAGVALARQEVRLREEQMAWECGSREAAGLPVGGGAAPAAVQP